MSIFAHKKSTEYPCFSTVFAYSLYMQGSNGPPGQHGIPGVKGDEVKLEFA